MLQNWQGGDIYTIQELQDLLGTTFQYWGIDQDKEIQGTCERVKLYRIGSSSINKFKN